MTEKQALRKSSSIKPATKNCHAIVQSIASFSSSQRLASDYPNNRLFLHHINYFMTRVALRTRPNCESFGFITQSTLVFSKVRRYHSELCCTSAYYVRHPFFSQTFSFPSTTKPTSGRVRVTSRFRPGRVVSRARVVYFGLLNVRSYGNSAMQKV